MELLSFPNRRWALRCDDPQQLAEIDAVFVTVEPQGGSQKPTGKAFLYAMLRKEANHPQEKVISVEPRAIEQAQLAGTHSIAIVED
jgi:hypothetical protein